MASMSEVWKMLDALIEKYGGSIYDYESRKSWDPGQAVCREVYGPGWNDDPQFLQDNEVNANEGTVPDGYIEAGYRMIETAPAWMVEPTTVEEGVGG